MYAVAWNKIRNNRILVVFDLLTNIENRVFWSEIESLRKQVTRP